MTFCKHIFWWSKKNPHEKWCRTVPELIQTDEQPSRNDHFAFQHVKSLKTRFFGKDITQKRFLGEDIIQKRFLGEDIIQKATFLENTSRRNDVLESTSSKNGFLEKTSSKKRLLGEDIFQIRFFGEDIIQKTIFWRRYHPKNDLLAESQLKTYFMDIHGPW